ncbi:S1 family peptidase [Streptomyces sp. NBC_00414]|uniref:hypothetical protein n=1 Tax=Streptomyces sp. NBC_00414 TaxID=2975739 RepID=UPI002E2153D6
MPKIKLRTVIWSATLSLAFLTGASSVHADSRIGAEKSGFDQVDSNSTSSSSRSQTPEDEVQSRLIHYATPLRDAAEHASEPGYTGIKLDVTSRAVDLYWKGELPPSVSRSVRTADRAVRIRVHDAEFSLSELQVPAREVLGKPVSGSLKSDDGGTVPEGKIVGTSPNIDGSGITVQITSDSAPQADGAARTPSTGRLAREVYARDVPVTVDVVPSAPKDLNINRATSPHFGGGVISVPRLEGLCSSGFAVRNNSGNLRMLTARHCGQIGDTIGNAQGAGLGTVETANQAQDVAIYTSSVTVRPQMHYGSWYGEASSNGSLMNVKGYASPFVGEGVYGSGAFTGLTGSIEVVSANYRFTASDGSARGPMFRGLGSANVGVAGSGDSGGPIFTFDDNGVTATGIISAGGTTPATCQGAQNRNCYRDVAFPGAATIATTLGLQGFETTG